MDKGWDALRHSGYCPLLLTSELVCCDEQLRMLYAVSCDLINSTCP